MWCYPIIQRVSRVSILDLHLSERASGPWDPLPEQILVDGDLVSIDCGAILAGWHGDAAITVAVGQVSPAVSRLIQVTEDALWAGIKAMARGRANRRGKLTDISSAIESSITRSGRYGIVEGYGGHGIGTQMHEDPFVPNAGRPGHGPALVSGLTLAIEPMVTLGRSRVGRA